MNYSYKTPVGTFVIWPQRTDSTRVELWVADECYGSYAGSHGHVRWHDLVDREREDF